VKALARAAVSLLHALLKKLKLDHLEAQLDSVCEQAAERELDYQSFLAKALQVEWQGRFQREIEARLRQSRFPWTKTSTSSTSTFSPRSTDGRCTNWRGSALLSVSTTFTSSVHPVWASHRG